MARMAASLWLADEKTIDRAPPPNHAITKARKQLRNTPPLSRDHRRAAHQATTSPIVTLKIIAPLPLPLFVTSGMRQFVTSPRLASAATLRTRMPAGGCVLTRQPPPALGFQVKPRQWIVNANRTIFQTTKDSTGPGDYRPISSGPFLSGLGRGIETCSQDGRGHGTGACRGPDLLHRSQTSPATHACQ